MGGMSRIRVFVAVEHKSFEMEGFPKEEEAKIISMTERGVGRTFRISTSIEGARWMGRFLCECSVGDFSTHHFSDARLSIVGCVQRNKGGEYIEFSCFKIGEKGRRVLCFPAGVDCDGWASAGSAFINLVDKCSSAHKKVDKQSLLVEGDDEEFNTPITKEWPRMGKWTKAEQMDGLPANNGFIQAAKPYVVESYTGVLSCSWWKTAVICTPSRWLDSWKPILEKIFEVFGQIDMTGMRTGEAIAFMQNDKHAMELAAMKPLEWEGVTISFRRWTPEFNAVPKQKAKPKTATLHLIGVPSHLKKKHIVEGLMSSINVTFEIDEETLSIAHPKITVKLTKPVWEAIPRVLLMEERGYVFKVFLEVLFDDPLVTIVPEKTQAVWSEMRGDKDTVVESHISKPSLKGGDWGSSKQNMNHGALDQFKLKRHVQQQTDDEWLVWRPLKYSKVPGIPPASSLITNEAASTTYADVLRKGKQAVGQESFFGPLAELNDEEQFRHYMNKEAHTNDLFFRVPQRNPMTNQKKHKQWAFGVGRSTTRKIWASSVKAQQKARTNRVVLEVLASMNVKEGKVCSAGSEFARSVEEPSPSYDQAESNPSVSKVAETPSLHNEFPRQGCDATPWSESSVPPGFGGEVHNNKAIDLDSFMFPEIVLNDNYSKTANWIDNTLIPTAVKLGVTSHRGVVFVESMARKVGELTNTKTVKETLNEDDIERQNYKDANKVLGDDYVHYVD
ncbi:hypothetical protein FRX31_005825 [Thalictrum thalictroides]|uniref:DUF4283 domain-containing protein n=1 Tax=Thalictrum thalictroides TaxID=46969 RepID=A0A7J6X4E1_THATH|nr:hypothetical protein FRX31_005825 [Thalictrum thalictroides]